MELEYILASTVIISALSFLGALLIKVKVSDSLLKFLVALSTGTLLGSAFFHLLPESLETLEPEESFKIVVISIVVFFVLEKFLHVQHEHHEQENKKAIGYNNLLNDFFHNFLDGIVIAIAFLADTKIGIATSIAIAFHEIPQEIGDYAILVYFGMKRTKALILNVLVSLSAVIGGLVGYLFLSEISVLVSMLLPFATGGLIYVSMSDLLPEVKRETSKKESLKLFLLFITGLLLMYYLSFFE